MILSSVGWGTALGTQKKQILSISTVSKDYYCGTMLNIFSSDGPVFIKKPQDISGESDKEVLLGCMAESNPSPSYRWFRNHDTSKL